MTTLMVWNGSLLMRNGSLAIGEACCCGLSCPDPLPDYIRVTVTGCCTWTPSYQDMPNGGGYYSNLPFYASGSGCNCTAYADFNIHCEDESGWYMEVGLSDGTTFNVYSEPGSTNSPLNVVFKFTHANCCPSDEVTVTVTDVP
jgi:hypothetical protein